MNIRVADIDDFNRMTGFLCSFFEVLNQDACRTIYVRASHQYNNLHVYLLIRYDPVILIRLFHLIQAFNPALQIFF